MGPSPPDGRVDFSSRSWRWGDAETTGRQTDGREGKLLDSSSNHGDVSGRSESWPRGSRGKLERFRIDFRYSATPRSRWFSSRRRCSSFPKLNIRTSPSSAKASLVAKLPRAPTVKLSVSARWSWSSEDRSRVRNFAAFFVLIFLKIFRKSKTRRVGLRLRRYYLKAKERMSLGSTDARSRVRDPDDDIDYLRDPDDDIDDIQPSKDSQLTSLLGNLSLLSCFASKKERGTMILQTVGVVTTLVVLSQMTIAVATPSTAFVFTAVTVVVGLVLKFLNTRRNLSDGIWRHWAAVRIAGMTVLPQVMWITFESHIPHSILPGILCATLPLTMVVMVRLQKVTPELAHAVGGASAWTATILFMWGAVARWTLTASGLTMTVAKLLKPG